MTALDAGTTTRSYDRLAPAYACLSSGYDHERWLRALLRLAREAGLAGTRALDLGCGTGAITAPLAGAGFDVTGVDGSAGMLEVARSRLGARARLVEADLRSLPRIGSFDLIMCVDDTLNHLLEPAGLRAALGGMARNLAPRGVVVLDLVTHASLRAAYGASSASADGRTVVLWRGLTPGLPRAGVARAQLTVFELGEDRSDAVERVHIAQRHHPLDEVLQALWLSGLEPLRVLGQHRGARLDGEAPDETAHHKFVVVARRPVGLSTWASAHGMEGGVC